MFSSGSNATQVFHLWANQSKDSGRRGDGRVYFEGRSFFSFGRHYVAGYIMPGNAVALFNATKYSPTTSGHVGACREAASHLTRYDIPELTALVRDMNRRDGAALAAVIRDHVTKYALEFANPEGEGRSWDKGDAAGAVYLLGVAGVRNAPAAFQRIYAAAVKARDKRKAKDAADEKAILIRDAKQAADMPDSEFRAALNRQFENSYLRERYVHGRWNGGESTNGRYVNELHGPIDRFSKQLNRYHKAGKAALGVRRTAKLWQRVKMTRAAMADFESRKAAIERNKWAKLKIRHVRQGLAELAKGPAGRPFTSSTYHDFSDALRAVAKMRLPAASQARLNAWADTAIERRNALALVEREKTAREQAEREAKRAADRAAMAEREKAARAAWFAGDSSVSWHGSDENGRAYIRAVDVSSDGKGGLSGTLQTSHGAEVPLPHAVRAFRFIKLCHDTGRAWHANGKTLPVGHFKIDSIDSAGNFRAGCHNIAWAEVQRLALALGVFDAPSDESALTESHAMA